MCSSDLQALVVLSSTTPHLILVRKSVLCGARTRGSSSHKFILLVVLPLLPLPLAAAHSETNFKSTRNRFFCSGRRRRNIAQGFSWSTDHKKYEYEKKEIIYLGTGFETFSNWGLVFFLMTTYCTGHMDDGSPV